jgi:hypothetical protein
VRILGLRPGKRVWSVQTPFLDQMRIRFVVAKPNPTPLLPVTMKTMQDAGRQQAEKDSKRKKETTREKQTLLCAVKSKPRPDRSAKSTRRKRYMPRESTRPFLFLNQQRNTKEIIQIMVTSTRYPRRPLARSLKAWRHWRMLQCHPHSRPKLESGVGRLHPSNG